jgi:LacI family transcriptional regulator
MEKINIRKLASILNISVATVSKAMRDSHEISETTKKKVWEAARKYNYTPNPYASSLRRKKSKTIAVILPEVADNFFSLAINGIQAVAEAKGYHVLIYLTHESFELEKTFVEDCCSGRVDGLLISITSETQTPDHIVKLQKENIPIVFFDREFEQITAPKVVTNDYDCGYQSAKLLVQRGCKNIRFLSISESLPICTKRAQGFLDAMAETDKNKREDEAIYYCDGNNEQTREQITKLLLSKPKVDGIVASVERLAIQVYLACQELKIKIPKNLRVIAFSTVETAPILNPSLSTVTQPAFDIGKSAAEILFTLMAGKDYGYNKKPVMIPSHIIERDSTK